MTGEMFSRERTLRNYVRQAFGPDGQVGLPNPSPFHLDTLARYVLDWKGNNKNGDNGGGTPAWFKYRQVWRERREQKAVAEEVELPGSRRLSRKWLWRGAVLMLLLVVAIATWQWFSRPKYWEENFDDVSVEGLKSRGWRILDYDSVAFSRQLRPGYLTLWTYPGDYWVKKNEKQTNKNLIIRRLVNGKQLITARLVGFDPYQNWQHAGLYFFGNELNKQNFFRV